MQPMANRPLPDPFAWQPLPRQKRRLTMAIVGAGLLGLLSSLLIGWALQDMAIAALFAGMIMAWSVIGYFWALGQARRGGGAIDWALVRAALDTRTDALAITDGEDRLICANIAYGTRCGGYSSPFDLAAASGGDAPLIMRNLAEQARRDGNGFGDVSHVVNGQHKRLRVTVRPAEITRRYLLWTLRRPPSERLISETASMVEGALGTRLGEARLLIVLVNRQGVLLAANTAFRQFTGVTTDRVVNLADLATVEGDSSMILKAADGGQALFNCVEQTVQADEASDPDAYLFIFSPHEQPVATPAIAIDNLPSLLAMLPLGLALVDYNGRLVFMNDAFCAAAGVALGDDVLYPSDLALDEDKALVADSVRSVMRAAIGSSRDLRVRLKARGEEPVILSVARAPEQSKAAAILSLKDDREQQKLEKQIAQATKMQAVGQLAGGVAHDFNNILTAVIGYCDLMLVRHAPGDPDFDDINQIRQNANRAANLVRQLLAFSRQQTLRPQLLSVSDVVGELSHLLKRLLGETIVLHTVHGRNLAPVRADPGQLEQVIVNLAVNARDAMPDGGDLTISTFAVPAAEVRRLGYDIMPSGNYVAISVTDSGTGIAPEILPKIFEPFFTTKEVGRGTGLGLSTVYGIVKQTGGYIFADSRLGEGTTFTIYLPAQEVAAQSQTQASIRSERPAEDMWGSGTILIVEDEAMVRAVAERALARKGYTVLTAANGEDALALLAERETPVDLLISDVVMPTMDGPTLVGHARERWPDLRIIFMSGYAEEQLRRSIDIPGVAFLPKPFSVQDLDEVVRRALA